MRNMLRIGSLAAAVFCAASGSALAASPATSCWKACFYNASNLSFFSQHTVCFAANNTWTSNTQAGGWSGGWYQNGDRVRWYGTTNTPSLATAGFGQFSSADVMSGEYAEWALPGTTSAKHYNYLMMRKETAQCPM